MKKIAILGSTGSIGTQTLDVVGRNDDLQVVGIAAGSNIRMLEEQIRRFHPKLAAVGDEKKAAELRKRVADTDCTVTGGMEGLLALAAMPESDILVTAIVGMIGIRPTVEGIRAGKDIALANKETLVTAGHIIMPLAKEYGVRILPVDSEHSAIFQALNGEDPSRIHKLLITASGGPFRGKKREELTNIRVEDALKHPNWAMGQKITIDSATLVNKGLRLWRQSGCSIWIWTGYRLWCSLRVSFTPWWSLWTGASLPSLELRICGFPFSMPCMGERRFLPGERLDFAALGSITFEEPDMDTFKGLPLAMEASKRGGSMPTVFNAANEKAVGMFLNRKIGFLDIYSIIEEAMERHKVIENPDVDEITGIEQETYRWIEGRW